MSTVFYETLKVKFTNISIYFKDFSRTTNNSRTIQKIQELLPTLFLFNIQIIQIFLDAKTIKVSRVTILFEHVL